MVTFALGHELVHGEPWPSDAKEGNAPLWRREDGQNNSVVLIYYQHWGQVFLPCGYLEPFEWEKGIKNTDHFCGGLLVDDKKKGGRWTEMWKMFNGHFGGDV